MDMGHPPGPIAPDPDHGLVPPGIDGSAIHVAYDRVLPGDQSHLRSHRNPHIGELRLHVLETLDFGTEMVVPHVVESDIPDAVLKQHDVRREQSLESGKVLLDGGAIVLGDRGSHVGLGGLGQRRCCESKDQSTRGYAAAD